MDWYNLRSRIIKKNIKSQLFLLIIWRDIFFSIFPKDKNTFQINLNEKIFPILSLLVSGGHTELVLIKESSFSSIGKLKYKKIGQTRDDAVGEAFDKVARMLETSLSRRPRN
jgi:hypothetical protein